VLEIFADLTHRFLLPFWHLQEIRRYATKEELEEALENLPNSVADVYKTAVERIINIAKSKTWKPNSKVIPLTGMDILGTVLHAKRRLTLCELQHALAFRLGDASLESLGPKIAHGDDLRKRTQGLVVIRDDEVQLAHETVHQYLYHEDVYAKRFQGKEKHLTEICLHYIQLPSFQDTCDSEAQRESNYPFLHYAVRHVGDHAAACVGRDKDASILPQLLELLNKKDQLPLGTLQLVAAKVLQRPVSVRIDGWRKAISNLHLAVIWHMNMAVESLLDADPSHIDLRSVKEKNETPLHVAARSANVVAVKMLLERGADVNATNYSGKTALDMILLRPYMKVQIKLDKRSAFGNILVTLLMLRIKSNDRNNEPPPQSRIDRVAFEHARRSEERFLEELLQNSDSEESKLTRQRSSALALSNAVEMDITKEEEEIALMLIEKGIDVNGMEHAAETPLQLAVIYGRLRVVEELLRRAANPFIDRTLGWTAVELAEQRGNADLSRLIKEKESKLIRVENAQTSNEAKLGTRSLSSISQFDYRRLTTTQESAVPPPPGM